MSSSRAVTAQWSISQTAANTLSISKGVIAAATSDNIQVIALLACEGFGVTIPMCPEICAKVHLLCSRSYESTVVSFLKAQVGFVKGDSGWQLSQSDAGLRFLALSACLLTIDWWRAAELLRKLITESAADKRLVPTSQQVKQLLAALNYRLCCSGFADNVVGWKVWLEKTCGELEVEAIPPSSETLYQLIRALSDSERIGETHSVHIQTDSPSAPWILAYIKWCLGEPPTVISYTDDQTLLQAHTRVFVHLRRSDASELYPTAVSTQNSIGSVNELWENLSRGPHDFSGMVQLDTFAHRLLRYVGSEQSLEGRAGREAVARGCSSVVANFRKSRFDDADLQTQSHAMGMSLSSGMIFPDERVIASTLADFLKDPLESSLRNLPENTLVEDLPSVATVKNKISASCGCLNCLKTGYSGSVCNFEIYMRNVSQCIATILLASLLNPNSPEGSFLHYRASAALYENEFTSVVYDCLRSRKKVSCSNKIVIRSLLKLVGHLDIPEVSPQSWIMSAHNGQTIYPQILSSLTLQKYGCLSLVCVPGLIIYQREKYSLVQDPSAPPFDWNEPCDDSGQTPDSNNTGAEDEEREWSLTTNVQEVLSAQDNFKGSRTLWQVEVRQGRLILSIRAPELPGYAVFNPMDAIWTASRSIFVTCEHDEHETLATKQPCLVVRNPGRPAVPRRAGKGKLGVVLSDGNEQMRFFALCAGDPCVIRDNACLQCCVYASQIVNVRAIVC